VFRDMKYYDLAVDDYDRVISLEPENSEAYYGRAISQYYTHDYVSAIEDSSTAIKLEPNVAEGYVVRARVYCETGQKELAKADELKATELGGEITTPCN